NDFAEATLANTRVLGPKEALTGAVARGSESLVRGHLAALRRVPAALELYRVLGETMLELAEARGSVDARRARGLRAVLRGRGDQEVRAGKRARRRRTVRSG